MTVHIKGILDKFIAAEPKISKLITEANAASLWDKAVDSEEQKQSEAIKVKEGTLYVLVSNSVWAQELSLRKKEILAKINNLLNKEGALKDIRFRTGLVRRG